MLEYARWKYVVALIVLLASTFYALPNLYPQDAAVQITANRGFAVDDALDARVEGLLKDAGIAPKSVAKEGENLMVRLQADDQLKAAELLRPALEPGYTVAQNLASTVPGWLDAIGAQPMRLLRDHRTEPQGAKGPSAARARACRGLHALRYPYLGSDVVGWPVIRKG